MKLKQYMAKSFVIMGIIISLSMSGLSNAEMASASYKVPWDSVDSTSSDASLSTNYRMQSSIGSTASGASESSNYQMIAGFLSPPDTDNDAIKNFMDNCINIHNSDQRDTNSDGYGNICDGDLNNDGAISFVDLGLLKSVFFTSDADADLNGDGAVTFIDLGLLKSMFFKAPGPSGIAP